MCKNACIHAYIHQVDSEKKAEEPEKTEAKKPDDKASEKTADDSDKEKKEEPLFEMLDNPARAVPAQVRKYSTVDFIQVI